MNQTTRAESVRRHMKSYEERAEAWKSDHDIAMHCFDVQETIAYGMFVFDRISRFDEDLHEDFFAGKKPFSEELVSALQKLYHDWWAAGEDLIEAITELEKRGYVVEGAEAFRQRCQEALGAATPDEQFFGGERFSALRDEAIDAHRTGQTETLEV